jgi:hypothetical protein
MKTEQQIEELKLRFANWVAEDHCRGCDEEDVVRTADTVQGFLDVCREYRSTEDDVFEEMPVKIINESQRFKGEQRKDLYILDVEEHIRLVIAI